MREAAAATPMEEGVGGRGGERSATDFGEGSEAVAPMEKGVGG